MKTLVAIELSKIFHKWRTYIGFFAIAGLTVIIQLALYFEGDNYINFATRNLREIFELSGNLLNGNLIAYMILKTLYIHIPFLIVLVGGDLLAGEAAGGTYRIMLTRPISRSSFFAAKFIGGFIYTNLLLLFLLLMSLGVSILVLGNGELFILQDKLYIFAQGDILWRFILAYLYASISMTTVLALSILFSSLVENAIGPIVVTMTVIIVFLIISAINTDFLSSVKPYLFVNHMSAWNNFFIDPVDISEILSSGAILIGHIVSFYLLTLIIFIRKDILT